MLRFANEDNYFEMEVPLVEDVSVHSVNGAVVQLVVRSNGYAAANSLWVHAGALQHFAAGLRSLERTLRGEATLESMSPNELKLRVFAASSRGHLAVQGTTGRQVRGENQSSWHSIAFGFEFPLEQLTAAVTEPWVRR